MVHDCMHDPVAFARRTGMSALASELGFAVLYPDQDTSTNPMHCGNQYATENHRRHCGEPESLAHLFRQAEERNGADALRTRTAGISASGAQT